MEWMVLVLAGICEVVGVYMLGKLARVGVWPYLFLFILCFGSGLFLLSVAMQTIAMGTAYAVWTGIGTAGSALSGMFFFNDSKEWRRLLLIGVIIAAAIGLRLTS